MSRPTSISVGVGAVVISDGRLLVVQRGKQPAKGLWAVPGGALEPGETIADGAVRELAEETGLVGTATTPIGVVEVIDAGQHLIIHDHAVEVAPGQDPVAADDADDARFVTRDQLASLPLAPHMWDFLDDHGLLDRLI